MIRSTSLCVVLAVHIAGFAQSDPPPDPFGETQPMADGYWSNMGQLTDEEGMPTRDAAFISDGVYPLTYPGNGGRVSFVAGVHSPDSLIPDTLQRWDMQLIGEQAMEVDPVGMGPSSDYRNFYLPHLGEEGATMVRRFQRVVYPGVYLGIDMHLYTGEAGQKMAFVCAPGSDPSRIAMRFDGLRSMRLTDAGDVVFDVLAQEFRLPRLFAYQYERTEVLPVEQEGFNYELMGAEVRFGLGRYDRNRPLVLFIGHGGEEFRGGGYDEFGLCWSTYFAGERQTDIYGSCVDEDGYYYVTGQTGSSWGAFPQSPLSPAPLNLAVFYKGYVTKFGPDHSLKWSAMFAGGGSTITTCYAVTTKPHANGTRVYVGGYTTSGAFPTQAAGSAYYDGTGTAGVQQGFIFKTDAGGFRTWCTYFGDQLTHITGMTRLGTTDNVVFTGISRQLPPEQVSPPAGSTHYGFAGGSHDAFIANLNGNDQLSWRTYYGGAGDEYAYSIATGSGPDFIYVLGRTNSSNIPTTFKVRAYNSAIYKGGTDMFLLHFNSSFVVRWATYFGGPGNEDSGWDGLAVDPQNNDVYVVGSTTSQSNFPLKQNGFSYYDNSYASFERGFITRFANSWNNLSWSTFFGKEQMARAVEINPVTHEVYVAGYNVEGTTPLFYSSQYYYQPSHNLNLAVGNEEQDGFIATFSGGFLSWSTYFGGNSMYIEHIGTLDTDLDGRVIATGRHSKAMDINTYFPLHEPPVPGYFDATWNSPPSGHSSGSFITKFCSEALPIAPEGSGRPAGDGDMLVHGRTGPVLASSGQGTYQFIGPPTGGLLRVYDTSGKLISQLQVRPTEMGSEPFGLVGLPAGLYVLDLEGARAKLAIMP